NVSNLLAVNASRKPLDDVRVRRALNISLDRKTGDTVLQRVWPANGFGILFPGDAPMDMPRADLEKVPGFGPDIATMRAEAKKDRARAGQKPLHLVRLNRNPGEPHPTLAIGTADQWKQSGVSADNQVVHTAPYFARQFNNDFDVTIDANNTMSNDPNEV